MPRRFSALASERVLRISVVLTVLVACSTGNQGSAGRSGKDSGAGGDSVVAGGSSGAATETGGGATATGGGGGATATGGAPSGGAPASTSDAGGRLRDASSPDVTLGHDAGTAGAPRFDGGTRASGGSKDASTDATARGDSGRGDAGMITVSFERDLQPIFDAKCTRCHSREAGAAVPFFDDGSAYTNLVTSPDSLVVPFDSNASYLYWYTYWDATYPCPFMPATGCADRLPEAELSLIKDWIDQGARDN